MEGFHKYRADTPMVLGLNVSLLAKVMKLADPSDSITLRVDHDSAPTHLQLSFENKAHQKVTEFCLSLITLQQEHLAIPETEYSSLVSLNAAEFTRICRELASLSDTLTIQTDPNFVQFAVEAESGSGSIKIAHNAESAMCEEDCTQLEVCAAVTQQFALRYLNLFNKAAPLSQLTRLALHKE
jgi:proliferating cell nuclear antigen